MKPFFPPERLTKGEVKYKRKLLGLVNDGQIDVLRTVATKGKGGLKFTEVRRRAWPVLVGVDEVKCPAVEGRYPEHPEVVQVELDLKRSLHFIEDDQLREKYRDLLKSVLLNSLTAYGTLDTPRQYYQGLHDIASVLLLHLGPDTAAAVLERLLSWHLKPWMSGGSQRWTEVLNLLPALMKRLDRELGDVLERSLIAEGLGCTFALPWLITWMTHNYANKMEVCARLLDFLLSTTPVTIVYLCAVVAASRRDQVLEHTESSMHYAVLNRLPPTPALEAWITSAIRLYSSYPPSRLVRDVYGWRPPPVLDVSTSPLFVLPADPQTAPNVIATLQEKRKTKSVIPVPVASALMLGSAVAVSFYCYLTTTTGSQQNGSTPYMWFGV